MTKRLSESSLARIAPPRNGEPPTEVRDSAVAGLFVRIYASGVRQFYVEYKRNGQRGKYLIGRADVLTVGQARDRARELLAHVALHGQFPDKEPTKEGTTLGKFLDDHFEPWSRVHHRRANTATIRVAFPKLLGVSLTDLTARQIEQWRTRRLKVVKPATADRDIVALKGALRRAVDWGLLETHPLKTVKVSRVDASQVRYLTAEERQRLLAVLRERHLSRPDHLLPMVVVSLNTGLRWGSLVHLLWDQVRLEDPAQITLLASSSKSAKTQHIALNSVAVKALCDWYPRTSGTGLVFEGRKGGVLSNVKRTWLAALKKAEITKFRWHDMRHDFASQLVMKGIDLYTVSVLLGHGSVEMTKRYAHLSPEHQAHAVAALAEVNA